MILLDATTRKLQLALGAAHTTNALPVVVSYVDISAAFAMVGAASQVNNSNGTSQVDILTAPASGNVRQLKYLNVFNADTVSQTVTIRYNDNGTTYNVFKATLATGEQLIFDQESSWRVIAADGSLKMAPGGNLGETLSAEVLAGAAVSLTSATPKDVTSVSLTAGEWLMWGVIALVPAGTISNLVGWIGDATASVPANLNNGGGLFLMPGQAIVNTTLFNTGNRRISLSATTTKYLTVNITFTSTCTAYGYIGATRVKPT